MYHPLKMNSLKLNSSSNGFVFELFLEKEIVFESEFIFENWLVFQEKFVIQWKTLSKKESFFKKRIVFQIRNRLPKRKIFFQINSVFLNEFVIKKILYSHQCVFTSTRARINASSHPYIDASSRGYVFTSMPHHSVFKLYVSTGPIARSLAPLTHSLAPHCSHRSRAPLRSLVRPRAHELVGQWIFCPVFKVFWITVPCFIVGKGDEYNFEIVRS